MNPELDKLNRHMAKLGQAAKKIIPSTAKVLMIARQDTPQGVRAWSVGQALHNEDRAQDQNEAIAFIVEFLAANGVRANLTMISDEPPQAH